MTDTNESTQAGETQAAGPAEELLRAVTHVTVVGAGTMGSQIAAVCALSGYDTALTDLSQDQLDAARQQLWARMDRDVQKGRREADAVESAKARLEFSTDLAAAASRTDFVIEAAVEDIEIKRRLFATLDESAPAHAILTTNSSNIVPSRLADATSRPERMLNMHFFNPALVMECVEVIPHPGTDDDVTETAVALAESLGKSVVRLRTEVPGFVANRLLAAIRREALDLYESGVADVADIDRAARTALRHPMGPFELMDLVGIDVAYLIRMAEYEQTGDPASLPHQAITELYEAGRYGRKTGRGWYTYDES